MRCLDYVATGGSLHQYWTERALDLSAFHTDDTLISFSHTHLGHRRSLSSLPLRRFEGDIVSDNECEDINKQASCSRRLDSCKRLAVISAVPTNRNVRPECC